MLYFVVNCTYLSEKRGDLMKTKQSKSKLIFITLYVLYVTFILLTSTVYLAENEFRGKISNDNYTYHYCKKHNEHVSIKFFYHKLFTIILLMKLFYLSQSTSRYLINI